MQNLKELADIISKENNGAGTTPFFHSGSGNIGVDVGSIYQLESGQGFVEHVGIRGLHGNVYVGYLSGSLQLPDATIIYPDGTQVNATQLDSQGVYRPDSQIVVFSGLYLFQSYIFTGYRIYCPNVSVSYALPPGYRLEPNFG